jgi:hypothetical protein
MAAAYLVLTGTDLECMNPLLLWHFCSIEHVIGCHRKRD